MIYKELTSKIIGCAMNVHGELGNGFQEVIYQRALEIEMNLSRLNFSREKEMENYFREHHIGTCRVDFFVEDLIMVEIKAIAVLEDVHLGPSNELPGSL